MSPSTPTTIAGRYELQRRLATGGMAEVWLAIDKTLNRRVAVKWLKPTLATDPIVAERFRREAIAAASLNHPNIVAVHDVFEQDGRQAVVMQLVDGKSLRQLLDTQNRLSPELTCHIGIAVARALDNAHAAGFVHRDVKPGNIMITPDGRVLLTDFGIAKGLHGDGNDDLTSDNIMMGTAKYLAPEQVRGKKLDGRADLYSLGLVMYECLAGRVPFLGESDADTALARLQRDPTDLARLRATLPTRLVAAVHTLLALKPEHRPADGATLIIELEAAQVDGPPPFDETKDELSPVSPFSAGRLVRAASDARGRANDRSRGMRQPTPPRGKPSRPDDKRAAPDQRQHPGDAVARRDTPARRGPGPLPTGPVGIIGEPPHITGRVPIQPTPSTRVAVTRANPPPQVHTPVDAPTPVRRDRTPPAGQQRGAPAKGLEQRWKPSVVVVGVLVALGLLIAVLLMINIASGDGDGEGDSAPTATVAGSPSAVADAAATPSDSAADDAVDEDAVDGDPVALDPVAEDPAATTPAPDPALETGTRIVSTSSFDPVAPDGNEASGGNGEENNDLVALLTDGDTDTSWRTECYSNRFMGAKGHVGVVVSFDGPIDRDLTMQMANGPYNAKIYASSAVDAPTTLEDWGEQVDQAAGSGAQSVTLSTADAGATHVLVDLVELGSNDACTDDNPFSQVISEISLA